MARNRALTILVAITGALTILAAMTWNRKVVEKGSSTSSSAVSPSSITNEHVGRSVSAMVESVEQRSEQRAATSSCPRLLLIVIFNNDFYKNIPYLRQLYGRSFQNNLVYYGPTANSDFNVLECTKILRGFLQHRCVALAMKHYPNFDGYVWTGDDAVLNVPRLLLSTDLNKVWTMRLDQGWPLGPRVKIFDPIPSKPNWYWYKPDMGMPQVQKAFKHLPDKYKQRMPAAFGMADSVVTAWSDAGYIPGKYREVFLELVEVMGDVTFECAFPTMLRLMCENVSQELVEFEGVYLAQYEKEWPPQSPILHPVKFSVAKNRQIIADWFVKAFDLYSAEFQKQGQNALPTALLCKDRLAKPSV